MHGNPRHMCSCKPNVDARFLDEGVVGCGGVLRGSEGEWLHGLSVKVQEVTVMAAEFKAIIEGLTPSGPYYKSPTTNFSWSFL